MRFVREPYGLESRTIGEGIVMGSYCVPVHRVEYYDDSW
jgi:hypothetical protein